MDITTDHAMAFGNWRTPWRSVMECSALIVASATEAERWKMGVADSHFDADGREDEIVLDMLPEVMASGWDCRGCFSSLSWTKLSCVFWTRGVIVMEVSEG